jgi:hypothetical protein
MPKAIPRNTIFPPVIKDCEKFNRTYPEGEEELDLEPGAGGTMDGRAEDDDETKGEAYKIPERKGLYTTSHIRNY